MSFYVSLFFQKFSFSYRRVGLPYIFDFEGCFTQQSSKFFSQLSILMGPPIIFYKVAGVNKQGKSPNALTHMHSERMPRISFCLGISEKVPENQRVRCNKRAHPVVLICSGADQESHLGHRWVSQTQGLCVSLLILKQLLPGQVNGSLCHFYILSCSPPDASYQSFLSAQRQALWLEL